MKDVGRVDHFFINLFHRSVVNIKSKFYFCIPFGDKGSDGRVARLRSAKPPTAVRIRFRPRFIDYKKI